MPTVQANGVELHYVERGRGEQCVVFAHSYLVDHRQFEGQIAALEDRFRVIAYDHRDHGRSGLARAPYTLDALVRDGVAVIEQTNAAPCHWVGLSTGGFVGMRLALHHRALLRRLVLMDTSAETEPWAKRVQYQGMFAVLRTLGMWPLVPTAMKSMFARSSLGDPRLAPVLEQWRDRMRANDPQALIRFGNAIFGRDDVLDALVGIDVPTLVMAGEEDIAVPLSRARNLASTIPGAQLEILPRVGHLCTVEDPDAVNRLLVPFLEGA